MTTSDDMATVRELARPIAENEILGALLRVSGVVCVVGGSILAWTINGWLTDIKSNIASIEQKVDAQDAKASVDSGALATTTVRVSNLEQRFDQGRAERNAQLQAITARLDKQDEKLTEIIRLLAGVVATQAEMQRTMPGRK